MFGRRNILFFSLGFAAGAAASAVGVVSYYKFVKLRSKRLALVPERVGVSGPTSGWVVTEEDLTSFYKDRR